MTRLALSVRDLRKDYFLKGETVHALRGVSFDVPVGDYVSIMGPSGSGKSTLLQIIGTLDTPTSGVVTIEDHNPFELSEPELAAFRNQKIGFVFQDHHLLPQCSVLENVLIPALAGRGAGKDEEQRAKGLLERVGLGDRLSHRPAQISGGERQRAAVCRALINRPAILLADEPTGNLDQKTAESVGALLLELSREEQTLLICVTHSLELASKFPQRRVLREGKLEGMKDEG